MYRIGVYILGYYGIRSESHKDCPGDTEIGISVLSPISLRIISTVILQQLQAQRKQRNEFSHAAYIPLIC